MAIGEITNPYEFFTNADGTPLEAGQIYIGVDGLDPQDNPKAAYFDLAGTIGATQPIRTAGGYPVNAGSATKIFTDGSFSVKVLDENNNLVYSDLSVSQIEDDVDAVIARVDAMSVPFDTVADFDAATLADIKAAANATTGTVYVETSDGVGRYAVDLDQATAFNHTTTGGVEVSVLKNGNGSLNAEAIRTATITDANLIKNAGKIASSLGSVNSDFGGASAQLLVRVNLEPGRDYDFEAETATFGVGEYNFDLGCDGGRATIKGTGVGISCAQVRNMTVSNINFQGFTTAHEWDTDNIDSNIITYNDCWFIDCGLGVDTVEFDESRSTTLIFNRCRAGGTGQIVRSFCDMLVFNDCSMRNATTDSAFVFADSQVHVNGGIWTPYASGATARWFDMDNAASGSERSFVSKGARFGPEQSGGIPVIYSWLDGNTSGGTRTTLSWITFEDTYAGCNNTATPRAAVVLMSDDGDTYSLSPNMITFRGGSTNGANGLVVTEAGLAPTAAVGAFRILMDDAAQGRWGTVSVDPSTPLVEDVLEKYMMHWTIDELTVTDTGADLTPSIAGRKSLTINASGTSNIIDLTDALPGTEVTLQFRDGDTTMTAFPAGNFVLAGGLDFAPNSYDILKLKLDGGTDRWVEVSRSVNEV